MNFDALIATIGDVQRDGVPVHLEFSYKQIAMLGTSIFVALLLALLIAKKL
tara:strand:+ start:2077 stop:2229 length:153 start_codon:yes stop_codon:yes gene_type:complete